MFSCSRALSATCVITDGGVVIEQQSIKDVVVAA